MRNVIPCEIVISYFIDSKDKNVRFNTVPELIHEGNVTKFRFVFKKNNSKKRYISSRIEKLDLSRKIITTIDGRAYKILNKYELTTKRQENSKRKNEEKDKLDDEL